MSRLTTPQTGAQTSQPHIPHDKVAMRAYEKWVKRGRPFGSPEQDWAEAEAELQVEWARAASASAMSPTYQQRR